MDRATGGILPTYNRFDPAKEIARWIGVLDGNVAERALLLVILSAPGANFPTPTTNSIMSSPAAY